MQPTPYILAVDIGSSAVKAGLYDAEARALQHTQTSIPHQQRTAADGTHEEDADTIQHATEAAIDRALQLAGDAADHIAAVGFDVMASTILGVDDRHNPVTPVYTYADTRSAQDVNHLQSAIDIDAAYQRTGVMQHTSYVPGRVLWLRRTDPATYDRIAKWTDIATFIFTRWFGSTDIPASYSASAWSGLLNRNTLDWGRRSPRKDRINPNQSTPPRAVQRSPNRPLSRLLRPVAPTRRRSVLPRRRGRRSRQHRLRMHRPPQHRPDRRNHCSDALNRRSPRRRNATNRTQRTLGLHPPRRPHPLGRSLQ